MLYFNAISIGRMHPISKSFVQPVQGELEDDTYKRQLGRTAGGCTLTVQGIASSCVGSDILDR